MEKRGSLPPPHYLLNTHGAINIKGSVFPFSKNPRTEQNKVATGCHKEFQGFSYAFVRKKERESGDLGEKTLSILVIYRLRFAIESVKQKEITYKKHENRKESKGDCYEFHRMYIP